ncbi:MAG: hypothetical protein IID45_15705, partial [Planctomycetes bacterium]|nr:hypothetical protein [Planctomycetota bacterium]
ALLPAMAASRISLAPSRSPAAMWASASAAVASALPGGDPLAAALAAGETPSPELVAAAGESGGLEPRFAVSLLAAILCAFIIYAIWSSQSSILARAELNKPPEVLTQDARTILERLGHSELRAESEDSAYGFTLSPWNRTLFLAEDPDVLRSAELPVLRFWYRESPRKLTPTFIFSPKMGRWNSGRPSPVDPDPESPGMVNIELDQKGKLTELLVVLRKNSDAAVDGNTPFNWHAFLDEEMTGLKLADFNVIPPQSIPPVPFDAQRTWKGRYPGLKMPIRVEAAAFGGKLVYFRIFDREDAASPELPDTELESFIVMWWMVLIASVVFAVRNIRAGRVDRRGAFRIALVVFCCSELSWLLTAGHRPSLLHENDLAVFRLAISFQSAVRYWLMYAAIEPYFRRVWPHSMTAWNRLLAGRFRDPLVGHHLLIGLLLSLSLFVLRALHHWGLEKTGLVAMGLPVSSLNVNHLLGTRFSVATLVSGIQFAFFSALFVMTMIFVVHIVVRKRWATVCLSIALVTTWVHSESDALSGNLVSDWMFCGLAAVAFVFVALRYGFFTCLVFLFVNHLFGKFVMTIDVESWYIGDGLFLSAAILSLAGFGFWTSLAGRPLFRDSLLERE